MKIFRLIAVLMISIITMSFSGCSGEDEIQIEIDDDAYNNSENRNENETETTHISTVKIGTLKGPTGVGALRLMELEEKEETY